MKTRHDESVPKIPDLDFVVEPAFLVPESMPAATQLWNPQSLGELPEERFGRFRDATAHMHNVERRHAELLNHGKTDCVLSALPAVTGWASDGGRL